MELNRIKENMPTGFLILIFIPILFCVASKGNDQNNALANNLEARLLEAITTCPDDDQITQAVRIMRTLRPEDKKQDVVIELWHISHDYQRSKKERAAAADMILQMANWQDEWVSIFDSFLIAKATGVNVPEREKLSALIVLRQRQSQQSKDFIQYNKVPDMDTLCKRIKSIDSKNP